jgi:hypothetical protein
MLYFHLFIIIGDQEDLLFKYFDINSKFIGFLQDALKY